MLWENRLFPVLEGDIFMQAQSQITVVRWLCVAADLCHFLYYWRSGPFKHRLNHYLLLKWSQHRFWQQGH